jgi:hypothetical protein
MFFLNFVQKYGRFNSPFFPIFIFSNEFPPINYLVREANEDPLLEPRKIAKMSFVKLDSESKVIIEFIGEERNIWYTIEKLVKSLLEDLWNKGYRINSVFPRGLLHPTKIIYTKKELIGKNIYIEGELIEEKAQITPGLSGEGNQSDLDESSSKGSVNTLAKSNSLVTMNDVDPERVVKRYGTYRELTLDEVRDIVAKCRAFQHKDGTIFSFYYEALPDYYRTKFSFETLRSWVKNEKFKP